MTPEILTFEQALDASSSLSKTHVLLGNGFSRACRDDIFAYGRLFERANFEALSEMAPRAFKALNTTDFEVVMRALKSAAALVRAYESKDKQLAQRLEADAEGLREVLASTIARSHPDRPQDIRPGQYRGAKEFLSHFNHIYTLNYDLLLYWALMQSELEPQVRCDDGFRQPESGTEPYVTWDVENTTSQNVYYLHGALHVFDAGHEVQKFTWKNTEIALIDQIRQALASSRYPLFVAEGSHVEKLARIQHSGFLNRAYRSFHSLGGGLFIYGHSMAKTDDHILHLIEKGKTKQLFIGLHGDPESDGNKRIRARAKSIVLQRSSKAPLEVRYFDAASAQVWG